MKKKSISKILLFSAVTIIVPCAILLFAYWLISTKRWFDDPMGYCINILMFVSAWGIVEFELYLSDVHKKEKESEFRIVDCMTIILTVITICYSFLQICNPPILFGNILKLILWFSAIIVYTILVKPTKMKVLCLCLVAVFISTLFVLPATYQEYYEEKIDMYKLVDYNNKSEYCYYINDKEYSVDDKDEIPQQESIAMFEKLLEDEYFVKNYSNTLCQEVYSYINSRNKSDNMGNVGDMHFIWSSDNLQVPNVYIGQKEPFVISFKIKSEEQPEKIRVSEIVQNGFVAEEVFAADGNDVSIALKNIRGISGYKNLTFLKGFVEDVNGNVSEEKISVGFCFFGYDIIILIIAFLIMLVTAERIIIKRGIIDRLYTHADKEDEY